MNECDMYISDKLLNTLSNCKQQLETVKQTYLNSADTFTSIRQNVNTLLNSIVDLYKTVDSMKNSEE